MGPERFIKEKLNQLEDNNINTVETHRIRSWFDEYHNFIDKATRVNSEFYYPDEDEFE